jgi:hypothetical protein
MPQLKHGSARSCCCCCGQILRRGSAHTLRRAHWLAGLLFACICLTLAGFLNTDEPRSVTTQPPFGPEKTVNTIHTAESDLDTPVRSFWNEMKFNFVDCLSRNILFICGLFNDAVVSNDRMINE